MSNGLMNRQYVGARYVPKIMGEWNKALQYEALSVVTYMGNSFTSKVPVPANVEISNTDYWINSANYNAQVEEYRKETENVAKELNKRVEEYRKETENVAIELNKITDRINKSEFYPLIIGDSYNTGGIASPTWGEIFQTNMSLTDNVNSKNLGYASRGFIGYGDGDYLTELKRDLPKLTSDLKNKITSCIICGGANDCNANVTENKLTTAIKNTCEYITSILPNCKTFYIGFISRHLLVNNHFYIYRSMYQKVVNNLHYTWLNGMENALFDITHFKNDNLHPNELGMVDIGNALTQCIKTGYYDICTEWRDINYTLNSSLDVGGATNLIKERFNNGKCELMIMETNINNLGTSEIPFFTTNNMHYFRPQIYNNQEIIISILNNTSMCYFSTYSYRIRSQTANVVKIYNTLISLDIS